MGLTDLLKGKERKKQEQAAVERIAEVAGMESAELLGYLPASLIYDRVKTLEGICENVKVDGEIGIKRILDSLSNTQKLLRKNPKGLVALVDKYKEHTWGLLDAFGNNAVRLERRKKYGRIIRAVKENAGSDVGIAFSYLKVPVMRKYGDLLIYATHSAGENTGTMFDRMNDFFEDYRNRRTIRKVTGISAMVGMALFTVVGLFASYSDGFTLSKREAWEAFTDDVSEVSHEVRDIGEAVGPSSSVPFVGGEKEDPYIRMYPSLTPPGGNVGVNARVSAFTEFGFEPGTIPRTPEKRYGLELYGDHELVFNSFSVEDDCRETFSSEGYTIFECRNDEVDVSFSTGSSNFEDYFHINVGYSVNYTEPGQHTYLFRVFDRNQTLASDMVTVTFTGEEMDLHPYFTSFSFCDEDDVNSASSLCSREGDLGMKVEDIGDNPDLDRVEVFLNGKKVGTQKITNPESIGEVKETALVTYDTSGLTLNPGDFVTAHVFDGSGQFGSVRPLKVEVASKPSTLELEELVIADAEVSVDDAKLPVLNTTQLFHDAEESSRETVETTPTEPGVFNGYEPGFNFARRSQQEYKDRIGAYARDTFFVPEGRAINYLETDESSVFFRRYAENTTMSTYFYCNGPDGNPEKEKIIFSFIDTESGHRFDYHIFQDGRTREIITDQDGNRSTESDAETTRQHLAAIFQYFVNSGEVLESVPVPGPIE